LRWGIEGRRKNSCAHALLLRTVRRSQNQTI
jgi:hypothetical protein